MNADTSPPGHARASERYRVIRELGSGGMGGVELVFDAVREEEVARKRVLQASAESLIMLKREFRVIESLRHPNLVALYDLDEDEWGPFFTMEAVDGVGLREYCVGRTAGLTAPPPRVASTAPTVIDPESVLLPHASRPFLGPDVTTTNLQEPRPVAASPPPSQRTGVCDYGRLSRTLPQIVDALAFLHANGIVHRDVKPGNVMVRADGCVKLLDFGILAELGGHDVDFDVPSVLGTPGFMAPEQIRGEAPSPASDVYALGAMIFLLVSGRLVFAGPHHSLLTQHLVTKPERLASLVDDVPPEIDALCAAMLAKVPTERPTLEEVARIFGGSVTTTSKGRGHATGSRGGELLIGREALCRQLGDELVKGGDGDFVALVLEGGTGAGKTALAEELGRRAKLRGVLVLSSRARHNEAIPFNAVDGAIDALALALRTMPLAAGSASLRETASLAFPVLEIPGARRGEAVAVPSLTARPPRRGEVFAAVTGLLRAVGAASGGLLLFLDDLHWADADSVALLEALVDEAPHGVAVLATIRDDVGDTPAAAWLEHANVIRVQVPSLDEGSSRELVRRAAHRRGLAPSNGAIERAARASAGRPLIAELLGHGLEDGSAAQEPEGALERSLAQLAETERATLALIAAEDAWLPMNELAELQAVAPGVADSAVGELERRGLVRRGGTSGRAARVAMYHDAVAAGVRTWIGASELEAIHARIARLLEKEADASPHRLVRHLIASDAPARAVPYARDAARNALEKRAYSLAADMLRVVLEHDPDDAPALLSLRGDALQRSGRFAEAAEAWRALASTTTGDRQLQARLFEAHARLSAGDVVVGRASLDAALRDAGEPTTSLGALATFATLARFVAGPPRASARVRARGAPSSEGTRGDIERAELDTQLANVVSYYEPIAGMRFQSRMRDRCDRAGQAEYAAWSEFTFAYLALFTQPERGPCKLAERYRAAGEARLAGRRATHPAVRAFPGLLDAVAAQRDGRWREGVSAADAALAELEGSGVTGTFEHLFVLVHRTQLDLFSQNAGALAASLARLRQASRDLTDSALKCHVVFAECTYRMMIGDVAAASRAAKKLEDALPKDVWTFQRVVMALAAQQTEVLTTDCRAARRRVNAVLEAGAPLRPFRTMYAGQMAGVIAMIEACALRGGDPEASYHRVRRYARLCRRPPPLGQTLATRALAYAEDGRGRRDEALRLLVRAEAEAMAYGQTIDAAIARFQRGLRLRGDEGKRLCDDARQLARTAGAREIVLAEDPALR